MSIREHKRNINQYILICFDIIIVCIIFVRDNVKIAMISIIVPLYNAEKYVHACVDSILGQTYKDFELLLVDDGSKDSTGTICDKYANDDHRVRVFHKKNDGPASAKNYGLERAEGQYVIFVNADDFWFSPDTLSTLHGLAEKHHADIVKGEYVYVDEDGKKITSHRRHNCVANKVISRHRMLRDGFAGELSFFLALIRKEKMNGLLFDESFSFDEDPELFARLFCRNLRCVYTPMEFYAYRVHPDTIRAAHKLSSLQCSFSLAGTFARCSSDVSGKLRKQYRRMSVNMYYRGLQMMTHEDYNSKRKTIIKVLKLNELQKKTRSRIFKWGIFNSHFFSCIVPPATGISFVNKSKWASEPMNMVSKSSRLSNTVYFNNKGEGGHGK